VKTLRELMSDGSPDVAGKAPGKINERPLESV